MVEGKQPWMICQQMSGTVSQVKYLQTQAMGLRAVVYRIPWCSLNTWLMTTEDYLKIMWAS